MRGIRMFFLSVMVLGALASPALGVSFSGTLSTDDAFNSLTGAAQTPWEAGTSLGYTVSRDSTDDWWHYEYTFTVPSKGLSHIIFEASSGDDPFTAANLKPPLPSGYEVKDFGPLEPDANSNPGLLWDVYGIKFNIGGQEAPGGPLVYDIEFYSDRAPMWGDFYAKDGKHQIGQGPDGIRLDVYAYNSGIGLADPAFAALLGYIDGDGVPLAVFDGVNVPYSAANLHLLVPDTISDNPPPPPPAVPEPLTVTAMVLGSAGLGRYVRRRTV